MKDKCTCTSTLSVAMIAIGTGMFISSSASAQQGPTAAQKIGPTTKFNQARYNKAMRVAALRGKMSGGIAGASNCCTPNGGLGCDDPACQATVCAVDPFCCSVAWDTICAGEAASLCGDLCQGGGGTCPPSANDCCFPGSGPGCSDTACCETVCAADPFCCSNTWDGICAGEANSLCGDLCGGGTFPQCPNPAHDCFTTGTPGCSDEECCNTVCNLDSFCCTVSWDGICVSEAAQFCFAKAPANDNCVDRIEVFDGETSFSNIGATTDGPAHVICDFFGDNQVGSDIWYNYTATETGLIDFSLCGSGYDTKIAVYDGCSCPVSDANILACNDDSCGLQSLVSVNVVAGNCYKVRIGGFAGSVGSGTLFIGSCDVICPPGASAEGEPCGSDTNGGCNSTPTIFGSLTCGETVCGDAWAVGGTRDTDWYEFDHSGGPITWTVVTQFPGATFLISGTCPPAILATGAGLCPIVASADLPAGTYRAFVAPGAFDGLPCGGGNNGYVGTLECSLPCLGDTNGDGVVDVNDLLNVINGWGKCD